MGGIYLDHNGTPTPIADLCWVQRARCGCISGLAVVDQGPERPLLTPDDARAEFAAGIKALIKRSIEDGQTYELRDTASQRGTFGAACTHDPKWGVARVAAPEGWAWATTRTSQERSHIRHLAPSPCSVRWPAPSAMCGYDARGQLWRTESYALADTVTCRRCEAKAAEVTP